jgi:hypothetical protein
MMLLRVCQAVRGLTEQPARLIYSRPSPSHKSRNTASQDVGIEALSLKSQGDCGSYWRRGSTNETDGRRACLGGRGVTLVLWDDGGEVTTATVGTDGRAPDTVVAW